MHSVMSRIYHPGFKCVLCKRPPQFGWLYRCTHDRDPLILSAKLKGDKASRPTTSPPSSHGSPAANISDTTQVGFDEISQSFAEEMNLGKFGPDMRTQKYAFFKEITTEQLHSYTPSQLVTILSQRDHVAEIVAESRHKAGRKYPDDNMPWAPDEKIECQHMICHSCHRIGEEKSWVSLDGVLNGDILPTVATGYSFSYAGSRPLVDVQVAKNLGCRPVNFPYYHAVSLARRAREGWGDLEDHIDSWFRADPNGSGDHRPEATPAQEDDFDDSISDSISDSDESFDNEDDNPADWTPPSPEHVEDAHSDEVDSGTPTPSQASVQDHYRAISSVSFPLRPPWTPPPTPSDIMEELSDEAMDKGRSPSSLKTNPLVRTRLFLSFPTISTVLRQAPSCEYRTEDMCDVGLVLPLDDAILKRACSIPLPRPDLDEEFLFAKGKISVGDFKHMQAFVSTATTDAATASAVIHLPDNGVAAALMTEESVETGIPDVVLRVEEDNKVTTTDLGQAN